MLQRWAGRPRPVYGVEESKVLDSTFAIGMTVSVFAIIGVLAAAVSSWGLSSSITTNSPAKSMSDLIDLLYSVASGKISSSFATLFGTDLLVAAAAGSCGSLLGFIFGIPRTLDPAGRAAVADAAAQGGPADRTNAALSANTNLERVSDWLTTLLIGATLVQLGSIVHWVRRAMEILSDQHHANSSVLILLAIYYFGLGFLGIYLITRLYLTSALTETLGMLAGGGSGVSSTHVVQTMLSNARQSDDPKALRAALAVFENWRLTEEERSSATLNNELGRLIAKYTNTKQVEDPERERRYGQTIDAFKRAIIDANLRNAIRNDLDQNRLTTGNATTDENLRKLVS